MANNAMLIGMANELLVARDLMLQGFQVYQPISPSAPYDLVIYADGQFTTVEVKTEAPDGGHGELKRSVDILAIVTRADEIRYEPEPIAPNTTWVPPEVVPFSVD